MFHHTDQHAGIEVVLRANRTLLLTLLWAALAACVVSSAVYDVGHWVGIW